VTCGGLLLILSLLGSIEAEAAGSPPPVGDWNVTAAETVVHDGVIFDLRGDLNVRGDLTLRNCTLWVWSTPVQPRVLTVHQGGALSLESSHVAAAVLTSPYYFRAEARSSLTVVEGSFYGAGRTVVDDGRNAGIYIETDATVTGTLFDHCYAGLWASSASVIARNCDFIDCEIGAVASNMGDLRLSGGSMLRCNIGALVDGTILDVAWMSFNSCPESVLSYSGSLTVSNSTFEAFDMMGVATYSADVLVTDCSFKDADGEGVYFHTSSATVSSSLFDNCTVDVKAVDSEVWVRGTTHWDTYDEALMMYRSTFDIEFVVTNSSYWGLRTYRSSGECRNLTTVNATFGVYIESSEGVRVLNLSVDGSLYPPYHRNPRGVYVTRSNFTLIKAQILRTRNGVTIDAARGLIEDVTITDCSREGAFITFSEDLVLRRVRVTNGTDGFRLNLYGSVLLEDCLAYRCRATGFNFTAGDKSHLVRCNASANPVGVLIFLSSPWLEDCSIYQCNEQGVSMNTTVGIDSLQARPKITGGTVVGGAYGMYLNQSGARISDVTFIRCDRACAVFITSWSDVIEGCRFYGHPNASAVVVINSQPIIRKNVIRDMNYGIHVYDKSYAVIEGNTIEDITFDGIQIIKGWMTPQPPAEHTSAFLQDNVIRRCGDAALQVGPSGVAVSRNDMFIDSGRHNVEVILDSTLDVQGSTISGASIGIEGIAAP
jgi:parallel beta-helix repeat protein